MDKIDFSLARSASRRAAVQAETRAGRIRQECRAGISAVLDVRTLSNLQGAAIAGELSGEEMDAFRAAQRWVTRMQGHCRQAIADGDEPHWPDPPEQVVALARKY